MALLELQGWSEQSANVAVNDSKSAAATNQATFSGLAIAPHFFVIDGDRRLFRCRFEHQFTPPGALSLTVSTDQVSAVCPGAGRHAIAPAAKSPDACPRPGNPRRRGRISRHRAAALSLGDVGYVRGHADHAAHEAPLNIGADRGLHAEMPVVALLRGVHLGIVLAVGILRGAGCGNQRADHGRAFAQQQAALGEQGVDAGKESAGEIVPVRQTEKTQNGRSMGQARADIVEPGEFVVQRHVDALPSPDR